MSKQTALQKAIEQLQKKKNTFTNYTARAAFSHSIDILTELLPYEREVIEGSFGVGRLDGMHDDLLRLYDNSIDYFTKTFTDNEPHSK